MRSRARAIRAGVFATIAILPFLSVFVYMILIAFQQPLDITSGSLWPNRGLTFDNFAAVFETDDFMSFIFNSLLIGVGSTLLSLAFGVPAAFALAHWGLRRTSFVFLLARMLPGIALVVPWFVIYTQIDLIDTYLGMILSHVFITMPFITWMMIPFFEELPKDIHEASLVDGATQGRYFFTIAAPLVRTGMAAAAILAFIFSWNQFLFAVVLSGRNTQTVPVAVFNFLSYGSNNWGQIAAAAVVITVPVVAISLLVQRWIVSGLTAGAVKG
ncbi:carbohydrate ABC transporter permease [Herbiconiux sp. L3-i23]|uniref:carbohydrate ABC transporter permease n=1 Tax=Herbiconiux sp. L3-i23 TaxID=2905871 RepID=UPI0020506E4B|nr:carbohydrate ABC transporter permease [Herbiconiux sp. L3-i23]BDI22564.1 ABC transporter permease [Herbiconiux sp. L3-i23]